MFRPISQLEDVVVYFANVLRPQTYLELGVLKGERVTKIAAYVDLAVGVDMNVPELKKDYEFCHMATNVFFDDLVSKFPKFDMVFIDADHSYEQSYKDFVNVVPYVEENGLIFMHDTFPQTKEHTNLGVCGEVYKTAIKIRQDPAYEIVTIPTFPGMSIIKKRTKILLRNET